MSNRKIFNDIIIDSVSKGIRDTIPTTPNVTIHPVAPAGSLIYDKLTESIWYSNGLIWQLVNTGAPGMKGAVVQTPDLPTVILNLAVPITPIPIPFDEIHYDPEGLYNSTTRRFTTPVDGLYAIDASIAWEDNLVDRLQLATAISIIPLAVLPLPYIVSLSTSFTSGPSTFTVSISTQNNIKRYLLKGDQVEIIASAVNTAGGALPPGGVNVLGYFSSANLRGTVASFVRLA